MRRIGPQIYFLELKTAGEGLDAVLRELRLVGESGGERVFRGDEKTILRSFLKFCKDVDILVTWSGESFALPLLTAKIIKKKLDPAPLYETYHLDLKTFFEKIFSTSVSDVSQAASILGLRKRKGTMENMRAVFIALRSVLRVTRPELAL
ncbi:MAG: ribonuclease H-like domain-containing protein [Candidatus Caldarchaeum sp.]